MSPDTGLGLVLIFAVDELLRGAVHEAEHAWLTPAVVGVVCTAVIETLTDQAVRREVFDTAIEFNDDLTMVEVHQLLDALVKVLQGEN